MSAKLQADARDLDPPSERRSLEAARRRSSEMRARVALSRRRQCDEVGGRPRRMAGPEGAGHDRWKVHGRAAREGADLSEDAPALLFAPIDAKTARSHLWNRLRRRGPTPWARGWRRCGIGDGRTRPARRGERTQDFLGPGPQGPVGRTAARRVKAMCFTPRWHQATGRAPRDPCRQDRKRKVKGRGYRGRPILAPILQGRLVSGNGRRVPSLQGGIHGPYYALGREAAHRGGQTPSGAQIRDRCKGTKRPSLPREPISIATWRLDDQLDSLTSFWSIGGKPTGSRDPFALRRARNRDHSHRGEECRTSVAAGGGCHQVRDLMELIAERL